MKICILSLMITLSPFAASSANATKLSFQRLNCEDEARRYQVLLFDTTERGTYVLTLLGASRAEINQIVKFEMPFRDGEDQVFAGPGMRLSVFAGGQRFNLAKEHMADLELADGKSVLVVCQTLQFSDLK